jgi:DNA-damage-inducible protein D
MVRLNIMDQTTHFALSPNGENEFERLGQANGNRYWYARDFMRLLGYDNFTSFKKAINKAIGTCTTLGIPVVDNFTQVQRTVDGVPCEDFKLSRFSCYLVAMNGNTANPEVASAQAYFAAAAEAVRQYIQNVDNVERVLIRDELADREHSLSGVAKSAGVSSDKYGLFHNAGYRGMYNMDYRKLRDYKGVDASRTLLDFMGKQELAANLFRITETEAKIRNEGVRGQVKLENAAHEVGKRVRNTMKETSGTYPEHLPIVEDIKDVKRGLKQASRIFDKLDGKKKTKTLLIPEDIDNL